MNNAHQISDSHSHGVVTRTLDAVDRTHARAAARLHDLRNGVRGAIEHGLDRIEGVLARARDGIKRADERSASAVNRAQGAVGQAIERVRHSRLGPAHLSH